MINSLILIGIVVTTVLLSVVTTKQMIDSGYHSAEERKRIIIFIWLFPIVGPLLAVVRLREGAILHKEKMDRAMIDKLHELTEKIDGMREQVVLKKKSKLH